MSACDPNRRFFVLFGGIFFILSVADIVRSALEPEDIWWTPSALAVTVPEARDRVEIDVRGGPLQEALQTGSLRSTDKGAPAPLGLADIRIRFNNRDQVKAQRLPFLLIASFGGRRASSFCWGSSVSPPAGGARRAPENLGVAVRGGRLRQRLAPTRAGPGGPPAPPPPPPGSGA